MASLMTLITAQTTIIQPKSILVDGRCPRLGLRFSLLEESARDQFCVVRGALPARRIFALEERRPPACAEHVTAAPVDCRFRGYDLSPSGTDDDLPFGRHDPVPDGDRRHFLPGRALAFLYPA